MTPKVVTIKKRLISYFKMENSVLKRLHKKD